MFSGEGEPEEEGEFERVSGSGDEETHGLSSQHGAHASIGHRVTVDWPRYEAFVGTRGREWRGKQEMRKGSLPEIFQDRRFGAGQAEIKLMLSATTEGRRASRPNQCRDEY